MDKKLIVSLVIGLVIGAVLGGALLSKNTVVERVTEQLGAISGPEITERLFFKSGYTDGGRRVVITPTSGSVTIAAADLKDAKIITFTASSTMPALTATLAASSTLTGIAPNIGDEFNFIIENPFTAAATTTTVAAGTGIDLQEPDGQNVVIGINNYAYITCTRGLNSGSPRDIVCRVDETIPAD